MLKIEEFTCKGIQNGIGYVFS